MEEPLGPKIAFIDFRQMAEAVADLPGLEHIAHALEGCWRAQSCHGDLNEAEEMIEALGAFLANEEAFDHRFLMAIKNALLANAVMLYARATATIGTGGERGAITISQKHLTEEQHLDHLKIIDVRNRANAHVYRDELVADELWVKTTVFGVINLDESSIAVGALSNRISYHEPTYHRLARLIPVVKVVIKEKCEDKFAKIMAKLDGSGIPHSIFHQCNFDPVERFGEDGVEIAIAGLDTGTASGFGFRSPTK